MPSSTVCLIAKNEERGILEWIAYQRLIGFDKVMVYDNDSSDSTARIVQRAIANDPSITLTSWPNQPGRRPQLTAYEDALSRCKTDWIAFFDTDEFLLPRKHDNVSDYLASFDPAITGILLNWLVFGSSGHEKAENRFVIERFTQCASPGHGKNLFTKTIVRPGSVKTMRVHSAILSDGLYSSSSGKVIEKLVSEAKSESVDHGGAQLNHYLLKSREEYQTKVKRGHASRALDDKAKQHIHDVEEFWRHHDLNDRSETRIIDRFGVALKRWTVFLAQ